jgi:hypothetical protein
MRNMMFTAYGHPNITSTHPKTFEFTRDEELTLKGDCIIGVKADYRLEDLGEILKNERLRMTIKIGNKTIVVMGKVNNGFSSGEEMVLRRTEFLSERTLAVRADKAAIDFLCVLERLKDPGQKIFVEIEGIDRP